MLEDGEPGLDGVTVNLLAETGAVLSSTVTANGGYYQFDKLPAGIYSMEVLPPIGMASSTNLASSIDPNNGLDKDDNGVLLGVSAVRSNSIALGLVGIMPLAETDLLPTASLDASSNLTIDFGFYLPVRVGDYVWYDNNYNGIQDGEPGVAGVQATLYSAATNLPVPDGNGNPLTRITDANGVYQFDNLPPGDYYVLFDLQTLPPSYQLTRQNVGLGGSNSNADISAQTSNTGFLASGGENLSLDVGIYANFDLALRKRLGDGQPGTVNPGDTLRFVIEIFNQGTVPAANIEVTDYLPPGLLLADDAWTPATNGPAGAITRLIPGPLLPGASTTVELLLRVDPNSSAGNLTNNAEISRAQDDQGQPRIDIDSMLDNDPANDGPAKDDLIDENHQQNPDQDEDDQDIASITVGGFFDLALRKTLAVGQPALIKSSDEVTFTIQVINQGTLAATNIEVIDYLPADLVLNDSGWVANGNRATYLIPGPLLPGESITVNIRLSVIAIATRSASKDFTELVNYAEISRAHDSGNNLQSDVDSTPDSDNTNDGLPKDDMIDEQHKARPDDDEDDHDVATIRVGNPQMIIQKRAGDLMVQPGAQIVYTLVYTNVGVFEATNVFINELVPENTTFVTEASSPGWQCVQATPGSLCTYAVGTVPAQTVGAAPLIFTVVVDQLLDPTLSTIQNVARLVYDNAPTEGVGSSDVTVTIDRPTSEQVSPEPLDQTAIVTQLYLPLIQNSSVVPDARSGFKKPLAPITRRMRAKLLRERIEKLFIENGVELSE